MKNIYSEYRKKIASGNINSAVKEKRIEIRRKLLKNRDFSIIASNCIGGIITHDLGLPFSSPTVNLTIKPDDYICFLADLKKYLRSDLSFSDEEENRRGYPVGILEDGIKLYFLHYTTREEAAEKWKARSKRINFSNLFILFSEQDGVSYQNLLDFDALPYQNKVVLTTSKYPDIKSSYYLKGVKDPKRPGILLEYVNGFSGKRYFELFPHVKWLNGKWKSDPQNLADSFQ